MIVDRAYLEMYPDGRMGDYSFSLKYSAKFNDYNANVKRKGKKVEFNLSHKWEQINEDVKLGLIQSLMNKLFKSNANTQNIELYDIFLKKVHIAVPKTISHPILENSFNRVNEKYFNGIIEIPNLKWGLESLRKLGSYEYGSDTITISKVFWDSDTDLLDYVMYHEMLHKKHKFYTKNGKSYHHTKRFSDEEKLFDGYEDIERKLSLFLKKYRVNSIKSKPRRCVRRGFFGFFD